MAMATLPCKIKVTNPAYTYTVIYKRIRTCGDGHERVFGDFQSYRLENKSIWVVFRVEFDGDIHFCVAPPKSMVLLIFIDFFGVFSNFFVFGFFAKLLIFFSVPPPSRKRCRRGPAAAVAAAAAFCHFNFARECMLRPMGHTSMAQKR